MPQVSKIELSTDELNVLQNSDFFRLKQSATEKISLLFAQLQEELSHVVAGYPFIHTQSNTVNGKIFRGENYRKLPYVVLDYPKHFSADSVFTYRTVLWWANEFSFTLHLSGHALEHFRVPLMNNIQRLEGKNFYFGIHHKQWEYHFEKNNYLEFDEIPSETLQQALMEKEFIKISRRLPVNDIGKVIPFGMETFEILMSSLHV